MSRMAARWRKGASPLLASAVGVRPLLALMVPQAEENNGRRRRQHAYGRGFNGLVATFPAPQPAWRQAAAAAFGPLRGEQALHASGRDIRSIGPPAPVSSIPVIGRSTGILKRVPPARDDHQHNLQTQWRQAAAGRAAFPCLGIDHQHKRSGRKGNLILFDTLPTLPHKHHQKPVGTPPTHGSTTPEESTPSLPTKPFSFRIARAVVLACG